MQHALPGDLNSDNELSKIVDEYDQRLKQQVAQARNDVLQEMIDKIQVSVDVN